MGWEDRRKSKRTNIKIPVELILTRQEGTVRTQAQITNLSEGGAFIHCTEEMKEGETIFLRLQYEERNLFKARVVASGEGFPGPDSQEAVVRWLQRTSGKGFGIEFLDLKSATKKIISDILSQKQNNSKPV